MSVARPFASLTIAVVGTTSPASLGENVTDAPETALPLASVTFTDGAIANGLPAAPRWLSPSTIVSFAATSGAAIENAELVMFAMFPLDAISV